MAPSPFALVTPGVTRGLGLGLTRQLLRNTKLPVFSTTRTKGDFDILKKNVLSDLNDVDPSRLNILQLDLTSEDSIASAAQDLSKSIRDNNLSNAYIHSAYVTGGMLVPEKRPADLDWNTIQKTFQINVISHHLIIKHFSQFLPRPQDKVARLSRWVHVSARVGSIDDNRRGGWYSYRSSKAALNQVVKSFDLYLQQHKHPAMCVAMHPGTVKTDLSKDFWKSTEKDKLFEPQDAAAKMIDVVESLSNEQRGQFWDWAGKRIQW